MIIRTFHVPGKVRGAQRHRTQLRYRGGVPVVHMHRTDSDIAHGQDIRSAYLDAYPDAVPHEGPVTMRIVARVLPPKGAWDGKKCLTKPDWDNIGKLVGDALNRVAYRDDSQIFEAKVIKRYCKEDETEGLSICIELLDQTPKPTKARGKKAAQGE